MKNQEKIAQLDIEKRALMCCKLCDLHISCWNCQLLPLCNGTMQGASDRQWVEWLEAEADDER